MFERQVCVQICVVACEDIKYAIFMCWEARANWKKMGLWEMRGHDGKVEVSINYRSSMSQDQDN